MGVLDVTTNQLKLLKLDSDLPPDQTPRTVNTRAVVINNRWYVLRNLDPASTNPIQVIDPILQRIFNLKLIPTSKKDDPPNKPTSARINYALAECGNKIFMYGGLNEKSEVLETMDQFNAMDYKFTPVKYRGDFTPRGR